MAKRYNTIEEIVQAEQMSYYRFWTVIVAIRYGLYRFNWLGTFGWMAVGSAITLLFVR